MPTDLKSQLFSIPFSHKSNTELDSVIDEYETELTKISAEMEKSAKTNETNKRMREASEKQLREVKEEFEAASLMIKRKAKHLEEELDATKHLLHATESSNREDGSKNDSILESLKSELSQNQTLLEQSNEHHSQSKKLLVETRKELYSGFNN